ncbi:MAG TPA: hypothetical protein VMR29_00585 [Candidatus Binatia bacterium]|nr:hypothetical protein [Candidatus Binatia bacterium]
MTQREFALRSSPYARLQSGTGVAYLLALVAGGIALPLVSAPSHTILHAALLAWTVGVTAIYCVAHHVLRATRAPQCASCGRALEGYFARMALKTGNCEHCNAGAFSVSAAGSSEPDEFSVSRLRQSPSLR